MNDPSVCAPGGTIAVVSFEVGPLLLGLEITQVREINRQLELTRVPHAPPQVRGVVNLRGEVVTVVDLHRVLGFPSAELGPQSRNLMVLHQGEVVGLLVDRVADILELDQGELSPPPANLQGAQGRFFRGVWARPQGLLVWLDLPECLHWGEQSTARSPASHEGA